jgi:hypothetical protein
MISGLGRTRPLPERMLMTAGKVTARNDERETSTMARKPAKDDIMDNEVEHPIKGKTFGDYKPPAVRKKSNDQELANLGEMDGYDYLQAYADAATQRNIIGKLLKFSKGDWLLGQESEEVEEGTEVVFCLDTLETGWIKWSDNKPVASEMGKAFKGFTPMKRSELGDDDEDKWEIDDRGEPRDPWQFTNVVQMRPLDWDGEEANLFTFSASSKGGIDAIGKLMKAAVPEARQKRDQYPVITLGVRSYLHPKKEYGRIKTPEFEMTGEWVDKEPMIKSKPAAKKTAKPESEAPKGKAKPRRAA